MLQECTERVHLGRLWDYIYNIQSHIAFLDVLISRRPDKTLTTTVYRKPTHTDKYLDFKSNHSIAHKLAVIRTLNHRARNPPSTPLPLLTRKCHHYVTHRHLSTHACKSTSTHPVSHTTDEDSSELSKRLE